MPGNLQQKQLFLLCLKIFWVICFPVKKEPAANQSNYYFLQMEIADQSQVVTEQILKYHTFYKLINKIEKNGTPIGRLAEESGKVRDEDSDSDSEDDKAEEGDQQPADSDKKLRDAVKNAYKSLSFAFNLGQTALGQFNLQIKASDGSFVECGNQWDLKIDAIKQQCAPAPFGDLASMTTKVDPDVRSGLTIDYERLGFYVESKKTKDFSPHNVALEKLLEKVQEEFQDDTLYLEPYKLNMYEQGGHFKAHKDTPRYPNMVGTMVIRLQPANKGGELVIRHNDETFTENHSVTAFFCDREHEIMPVIKGTRVALTYNICKDNESVPKTPLAVTFKRTKPVKMDHNIASLIGAIKNSPYKKIGILTEFDYTQKGISLKSLKGSDRALYEELSKDPAFSIELLPVVVSQHYSDNSKNDEYPVTYYIHGKVYRFLNEDMERMMRGEKVSDKEKPTTVFFWNKKGLEVYKHHQEGAMHTGNESLEEAIDNIYFNAAIIVTDATTKPEHLPKTSFDQESFGSDIDDSE